MEVVRHAAIISWPVGLMVKRWPPEPEIPGSSPERVMVDAAHARQRAAVQPAVGRTHAVLPQLAVMIAAANRVGSVA